MRVGRLLVRDARGERRIRRHDAARQPVIAGHVGQRLQPRQRALHVLQRGRRLRHFVAERFRRQVRARPQRRIPAPRVCDDLVAGRRSVDRVQQRHERPVPRLNVRGNRERVRFGLRGPRKPRAKPSTRMPELPSFPNRRPRPNEVASYRTARAPYYGRYVTEQAHPTPQPPPRNRRIHSRENICSCNAPVPP